MPMPPQWTDASALSFHSLLLLERVQLAWLPGWLPEEDLATALHANPTVAWFLRHKCPEIAEWVEGLLARFARVEGAAAVRRAEVAVLRCMNDLLTYALDPDAYDAQPFHGWDSHELTDLIDFTDQTVLDIGAGTGRLTFAVADRAQTVFAVEPVGNLRVRIASSAQDRGLRNVFAVDGLLTAIPFPDAFADVVVAGHVFGDAPPAEFAELLRVTRPGGTIVLCPGNVDQDNDRHRFLVEQGCSWSRFDEPVDGPRRKYWLTVSSPPALDS